jgi:hypothetical protein
MRALRDWVPWAVFLCFDAAFPLPVSFFVAFLFLWQLEGMQAASVVASALGLEGLLRGDNWRSACSGWDVEALGAAGTALSTCIGTEMFRTPMLSNVGSITGASGEEGVSGEGGAGDVL